MFNFAIKSAESCLKRVKCCHNLRFCTIERCSAFLWSRRKSFYSRHFFAFYRPNLQSSHQPVTGFHPKCWLVPKIVPRVWVWVCSHKGNPVLLIHSLSFHGMGINYYPSCFTHVQVLVLFLQISRYRALPLGFLTFLCGTSLCRGLLDLFQCSMLTPPLHLALLVQNLQIQKQCQRPI